MNCTTDYSKFKCDIFIPSTVLGQGGRPINNPKNMELLIII